MTEVTDDLINCPYGYETCDEDDYETMCESCKQDRGEAHADLYNDTYD